MSEYSLAGKTVLITGAARGIGYETARLAHRRGARVALVDLDLEAAEAAASTIGDGALGLSADVADSEQIQAAVDRARESFGRVDVVIANAGITPPKTTSRAIDPDIWEKVVEINVFGVWRTVRAALPDVLANGGQAVLIASSYAHVNGVLNSSYAVSKAAVEALGRSLRVELAPHGASATTAYFGYVKTDLIDQVFENPIADRFRQEIAPSFLTKQISVEQAVSALVRGIEKRAPRVIEPKVWAPPFYLRGLFMPLSDRRLEQDPRVAEFIHEIEARDMPGNPA